MREREVQSTGIASRRRQVQIAALVAALVLAAPAQAENFVAARGSEAFDLLIVRPLGVGRVLVGVVCFIPAAIVAEVPPGLGGDPETWRGTVGEVWDFFVKEPVVATFMTPLGEFGEEY